MSFCLLWLKTTGTFVLSLLAKVWVYIYEWYRLLLIYSFYEPCDKTELCFYWNNSELHFGIMLFAQLLGACYSWWYVCFCDDHKYLIFWVTGNMLSADDCSDWCNCITVYDDFVREKNKCMLWLINSLLMELWCLEPNQRTVRTCKILPKTMCSHHIVEPIWRHVQRIFLKCETPWNGYWFPLRESKRNENISAGTWLLVKLAASVISG